MYANLQKEEKPNIKKKKKKQRSKHCFRLGLGLELQRVPAPSAL
jgi:hypothetical protein